MENIIEPNETFDFTKLTLAHPTGIQGGAYFTKIEHNKKPLYIQTTKSLTRQGFVKTGKKYYCDLMFDNNSEHLINWFENLEEKCRKLIFEKRNSWFQSNLEENDIETAFNSTIRVYKSGKYYLVRTNVKNTRTDEPAVKIYNENEIALTINDVSSETNIISILEIQGIKFTSRSFQIEIELKQVMVLDNEPIFNNCLIKTMKNKPNNSQIQTQDPNTLDNSIKNDIAIKINTNTNSEIQNIFNQIAHHDKDEDIKDDDDVKDKNEEDESDDDDDGSDDDGSDDDGSDDDDEDDDDEDNIKLKILEPLDIINEPKEKGKSLELNFEDLDEKVEENPNELNEIDMNIKVENNLESIKLKKPNQVYFELYVEARNKAKVAKKNAILAYLEAKNIKKTYMIDNINDSDDEFDAEIDEVSESELDDL